jgi:lysophospholipase L1-like esterase
MGSWLRRLALLAATGLVWFGVFEWALRVNGGSEAAPAFQQLFMPDPALGHRLRPGASTRFTTAEFSTTIAINAQGVRDDDAIGPKPVGERRVVVLGDSIVLAVQVEAHQTFCHLLEEQLNRRNNGIRYRVINAGVQGYGPMEEARFFQTVAARFEPDLVLVATFVANDAVEALDRSWRLDDARSAVDAAQDEAERRLRRIVRRSMVLQIVNQRVTQVTERLRPARQPSPDRRLLSYATPLREDIASGFDKAARAMQHIAAGAAVGGARTALVLIPARFQLDAGDFGRIRGDVTRFGFSIDVDAASRRFDEAYRPLGLPVLDLLTPFRAARDPLALFFQRTVHLTPEGHAVTADALARFIDAKALLPD